METAHPWTRLWPADVSTDLPPLARASSLAEAWRERVRRGPDQVAIRYFDGSLSVGEVDALSDALAVTLQARGVAAGDRVGIRLQNVPAYAVTLLALWKAGAAALLVNPMYRSRELTHLLADSGAVGLVVDDGDTDEAVATARGTAVRWVVSASARDFQTRDDARVLPTGERPGPAPDGDWSAWVEEGRGRVPEPVAAGRDDVALLTYTSGTTGPPKGAMNTHANVLTVAATYARWVGLAAGDVVLGMAPLFHITGVVVNATMALLHDTTLSLAHRFQPEVVLETFAEHGVTFTVGSITAFNALAAHPAADRAHFASVKHLYSGGAPIPPTTVQRFEERFGHYIHNVYGMTETSSAVIGVPRGAEAPVHASSNTLSIGVPLPGLEARVVDAAGEPVPPGEQGELELAGPAIVPGYWRNEEATERTMPGGRLRTGDGAVLDEAGWVYLVDRIKDQINVSGYKVWPREVEDALYEHPAVHEAAVVGRPDDYQGESVVAFVSLAEGAAATPDELVAHVRERLAAYKVPREVTVIADLPKTQTGKIRRRALRDQVSGSA